MPKRVLITRSPHQASELAEAIRALGMEPILIPTIEIAPPTTYAPLDNALANLGNFHWLLFTSANAVEAFAARTTAGVAHSWTAPSSMSGEHRLSIAAIGPATAKALELIGLTPTLLPEKAIAESLAEALLPHARQPDGTPTRFLLIRAEAARDHLPETLHAAGAEVAIAPAYQTVIPASSIAALRDLFRTPETYPDAITFTSSSTAHNLLALLKSANLTLPPTILRASIGPITTQTLQALGFPADAEAPEPNVASLATTVHLKLTDK